MEFIDPHGLITEELINGILVAAELGCMFSKMQIVYTIDEIKRDTGSSGHYELSIEEFNGSGGMYHPLDNSVTIHIANSIEGSTSADEGDALLDTIDVFTTIGVDEGDVWKAALINTIIHESYHAWQNVESEGHLTKISEGKVLFAGIAMHMVEMETYQAAFDKMKKMQRDGTLKLLMDSIDDDMLDKAMEYGNMTWDSDNLVWIRN